LPEHKNRFIQITGYYVTCKPTRTKKGEAMMFGCFLDQDGFFFDTNHFPQATKNFPFRGKGCYLILGKVAEEFGFFSINVEQMHKLDYTMYAEDAETLARSRPDPVVVAPAVLPAELYEYRLAIFTPPHITHEIILLRKTFSKNYNHVSMLSRQPAIVVAAFAESGSRENEIIKAIAAIAAGQVPFRIELENFSTAFQNSIVAQWRNGDDVQFLSDQFRASLSLSSKSWKKTVPQICIATALSAEKFQRAAAEFSNREYSASFRISQIVLQKRVQGEPAAKWKTVKPFMLEKMPAGIVFGMGKTNATEISFNFINHNPT
jgi:2'-5' RNA ligase